MCSDVTLIICGTPGFTYGCVICIGQTIFIKINRLTFQCPKYEIRGPEWAENDSHYLAQQEQCRFK